jgi:pyruvate/2-oxoglutarate dehydrogenase complex dihydrolipoamide dehydrogenase (E3) component
MLKEGVNFVLNAEAQEVSGDLTLRVVESSKQNEKISKQIPFDKILIAVGRKARSEGVNWGELGVELNPNGTLKVDSYLRANGKSLYACGDLIGPYQLTHAAAHQAWYCAVNGLMSPFKKFAVDYRVLPWVTFTDPEVARVGLSEEEAKAQGIPHVVTRFGLDDLDRAIADSENYGQVKIITAKGKDKILGASIVGSGAGEMLPELTLALKWNLGLKSILRTIHPYPTWTEANKFSASAWTKQHGSPYLGPALKVLEAFHRWRRH